MAEQIKIIGKDGLIDATGVKTLDKMNAEIKELQKNFDALGKTLSDNEKNFKDIAKIQKAAITDNSNNSKVVLELTEASKKLNEQYKKNKDESEKLKKSRDQLTEAQKQANKIAEQTQKLSSAVAFAKTDEAKALAKLKIQLLEINKNNKETIKASLEEDNAYKKKSKTLNDLRNQYKKLRAEEGKATKETEDLKRSIQELDRELKEIDADVGQFQRSVGNYEKALDGLGDEINSLSASFSNLGDKGEGAIDGVSGALGKIPVVGTIAAGTAGIVQDAFFSTEEGAQDLTKGIGYLQGAWKVLKKNVGDAVLEIKNGGGVIDSVGKAFDGTTDKINEESEAYSNLALKERDLNISQNKQLVTLQKLTNEYEVLTQRSGDATISLKEQQEASEQAAKKNVEISDLEVQIIQEQIKNNEERIKLAGENLKKDDELFTKRKELNLELLQAQNQFFISSKELSTEQRQIDQDTFEQRLDFLIDYTDNVKSNNERILSNDKTNLEDRRKLLNETAKLQENALKAQISLFEQQAGQTIDFDRLATLDADALFREIELLKLSEIENQRLLEVIRERRTAELDLIEAKNDIQEAALEKELNNELEKEQKIYNEKLENAKENAELREEIEKEHQQAIIDIQIKSLKRQLKNTEISSLRSSEIRLAIAELETEQIENQIDGQELLIEGEETLNQLANDRSALEESILGSIVDQGTALVKNKQAADIVNDTLKALISNFAATGSFGSFKQAGAGAAQSSATGGFAHGGYTGDGGKFEEAGIVHKGEYVIDKETTAALGMKNVDMNTLSRAVESTKVSNQLKQGQSLAVALAPQPVSAPEPIDYARLGAEVGKNIPSYDFTAVGHHYVTVKEQNKELTRVIHKSKNHIFTPKQIPNNPF